MSDIAVNPNPLKRRLTDEKSEINSSENPVKLNEKVIVHAFTDGSCIENPGPGSSAAIVQIKDRSTSKVVSEVELVTPFEIHTTNNRMELLGAITALEYIHENIKTIETLQLFTDSEYMKNGITRYIKNWLKNGWKTAEKKPVKNQDLWKQLLALEAKLPPITWTWVKAHDKHPENNRVDKLANNEARQGAKVKKQRKT